MAGTQEGQHFSNGLPNDGVRQVVERRRLGVDDDDARTCSARHGTAPRPGRPAGSCRPPAADRRRSAAACSLDHVGTSAWPNEIVALFRMPPHGRARRIVFAGAHAIERRIIGSAPAAAHADDVVHRAVHFDHALRGVPGPLVQAVDVLRHERVQLSPPLELHERAMAGVGLRLPRGMIDAALPRSLRTSGSDM